MGNDYDQYRKSREAQIKRYNEYLAAKAAPTPTPAPTPAPNATQVTAPPVAKDLIPNRNAENMVSRYIDGSSKPRSLRYYGTDTNQDLSKIDSGALLNRFKEFQQFRTTLRGGQPADSATKQPDNRSWWEKTKDNIEHYGTRAARGISTGAQMGASKLYDLATDKGYLDDGSFLGNALSKDNKEYLAKEMADINAALYHAHRGRDADRAIYEKRLRGIDTDLDESGTQFDSSLLQQDKFRQKLIEEQMKRYEGNYTDQKTLDDLKKSTGQLIDNIYGFQGNQLGTPSIADDLYLNSFRKAMDEIDQTYFNPKNQVAKNQAAQASALSDLMKNNPEAYAELTKKYQRAADKANLSVDQYLQREIAKAFDPSNFKNEGLGLNLTNTPLPEDYVEREQRYDEFRDLVSNQLKDNINKLKPEQRLDLISQVSPALVSRTTQLVEMKPEEALKQINDMDPMEARMLLDQISMFARYINADTPQQKFNYSQFEQKEDRDDFFPSFGGVDIVNRARQPIGGGSEIDQLQGPARRDVYEYNSMRDIPLKYKDGKLDDNRFFLAEDGRLGNVYFNPITGETNYELGTDLPNLFLKDKYYDTSTKLPPRHHQAYRDQGGSIAQDWFLVDDGNLINTYYNPRTGEINREFIRGNPNQFSNEPLPPELRDQFKKQHGYYPTYKGEQ